MTNKCALRKWSMFFSESLIKIKRAVFLVLAPIMYRIGPSDPSGPLWTDQVRSVIRISSIQPLLPFLTLMYHICGDITSKSYLTNWCSSDTTHFRNCLLLLQSPLLQSLFRISLPPCTGQVRSIRLVLSAPSVPPCTGARRHSMLWAELGGKAAGVPFTEWWPDRKRLETADRPIRTERDIRWRVGPG